MASDTTLRWKLADETAGQGAFFSDEELVERHVGTGEFRGLEFLHVNARRIVNEVPASSRMPFRYTINAYRGCSHACTYCLVGDTPILLADGRTRLLADIRPGDIVYGTERRGAYRRYVPSRVLAHWSTVKPAFRVRLTDGTELVASGDHRFLTNRGWKHVTGSQHGAARRPHLTPNDELRGMGALVATPEPSEDYRLGYLCGMIRGDAHVGSYSYQRAGRAHGDVHRFRLALADLEPLQRAKSYLDGVGIPTKEFAFAAGDQVRAPMRAIRTSARDAVRSVMALSAFPEVPSREWDRGFLAGMFDAEGSYSRGILRFSNTEDELLDGVTSGLHRFGFDAIVEDRGLPNRCRSVRIRGGLREHLRFFLITDPATTRKRTIDGQALKLRPKLRIESVEALGIDLPMFDITTETGDFIANGVVSHNCFARPTHEYLGLGIGEDFDTKVVVKVNAVERLRAELRSPKWQGHHIAMGTNTDPYQRCEGKYHLTRGIVGVLGEAGNEFSILTKSTLILRDLDVLAAAAKRTRVRVNFSIGTLDERAWKATEPGTPHPRRRVEAVRKLNDAGIPCGVLVAPILPGISDAPEQLAEVVTACVEAGAVSLSALALHLRPGVRDHFMARLREHRPDLVDEYRRRYQGAYLPKKEQEALSATVRDLVRQAGGLAATPRSQFVPGPSDVTSARRRHPADDRRGDDPVLQLDLGV